MKRKLPPLYAIVLLLAATATLLLRATLRQNGSVQLKFEAQAANASGEGAFNATLLKYASIDIGEPKLKQEIEELLEGKFRNRGRQINFLSAGKYRIDARVRTSGGTPLMLRSPEFHRLWLLFRRYLSDWSRNRRFHSNAMSDLVNDIKAVIDDYNGSRQHPRKKYKNCAVVGNSGILLKSEYGKLIDDHEAIIRLNNAKTASFERFVGSRTTISFVNSNILHSCARREGCFCHPYGPNVSMVMYICQPAHFLDYLVCNSSHKAPLIVTNPQFDLLCARIVKYYSIKRFVEVTGKDAEEWAPAHEGSIFHYSSGLQAIMLALGVCGEVSVFGFGKLKTARHHYHSNQKAELSLHDYEAEYDFYKELVKETEVSIPFVSDKFKFPAVKMYH